MSKENECLNIASGSENKKCKIERWYRIDKSMIIPKVTFALYGGVLTSLEPYLISFLISIGLSPTDAGFIGGIRYIGFIIGGNFFGFLADYKKWHRKVILFVCIGAILVMGSQPFVSVAIGGKENNVCPKVNVVNQTNSTSSKNLDYNYDDNKSLFYTMLLINIVGRFFDGSYAGFIDSAVIEKCRINPRNPSYGFTRVFGAIGFGLAALTSSILIENFRNMPVSCESAAFLVYIFVSILLSFSLQALFKGLTFTTIQSEENERKAKKSIKSSLDFDIFFFFFFITIIGMMQSYFLNFTVLILKEMGAPPIIAGLSIAMSAVASATFFLLADRIIKLAGGTWQAMIIANLSYVLRYIATSYVQNPWLIPFIQLFQGLGYGVLLTAAVMHIKNKISPEIRTTFYSIMNSLHFGLGPIIASISGGRLYEVQSARYVFKIASLIAFICFIITCSYFIIFVKCVNMKNRRTEEKENQAENILLKDSQP